LRVRTSFNGHLFGVIILITLAILWNLPTNSNVLCKDTKCASNTYLNNDVLKPNLVQSIDLRISLLSEAATSTQTNFIDSKKAIGLSWKESDQLLITVPMRNGKTSTFDYLTPADISFKEIRVKIKNSQTILIFLDDKIAYSHRYENSPFFVNTTNAVSTSRLPGEVVFRIESLEQTIQMKTNVATRIFSIFFVTTIFSIGTFLVLRKIQYVSKLKKGQDKFINPTFQKLIILSWVLSILIWIRDPIDQTGAVNPGPFGPIGAAFSDFYQLSELAQFDRPYDLGGTNYPPTGLLFLRTFTILDPNSLSLFILVGVLLGTLFNLFPPSISNWKSVAPYLLPFPLIFGAVRGNLDLVVIFLCWISILEFKKRNLYLSSTLLAIAISIKIWPLVFLLFFMTRKTIQPLVWSIFLSLQLTFAASFYFGYRSFSEAFELMFMSLSQQSALGTYAFQNTFSFTALMFIAHILLMARNPMDISEIDVNNSINFVNGAFAQSTIFVLLVALLYFFTSVHKFSTKFLILSAIAMMIPTQSFTYRGLVIFLFFFLIGEESKEEILATKRHFRKKIVKIDYAPSFEKKIATWSAIPLFAPTAFYFVPGTQFSSAALLQPLGLATFVTLMIFADFRDKSRDDAFHK